MSRPVPMAADLSRSSKGISLRHPHGVMFHHFRHGATHPAGQGALSAEEFADLLAFLDPARILDAGTWLEKARRGRLADGDLCLTFDDGLRCQADVALPVLDHFGLTAFWFVYSSVLEGQPATVEVYRYFRTVFFETVEAFYDAFEATAGGMGFGPALSSGLAAFDADYLSNAPYYTEADRRFRFIRDRILRPQDYDAIMERMMADRRADRDDIARVLWMDAGNLVSLKKGGHVVGLHSHSHPTLLAALPAEAQRAEYSRNAACLEGILGSRPNTVSHPCNSYGSATLDILTELGVEVGFRADLYLGTGTVLEIPREDHALAFKRMREVS